MASIGYVECRDLTPIPIVAVCEFGGHLDLKAKYVYADGMLLAQYDESHADTHYYHHDGLGSIMGMTDEDKSVEQSYFYDEFGVSLGSWGNVGNHYLCTGQEYDGSITQLYNLRARYYKPSIGRFISEDPVMNVASGCCLLFVDPAVRGVKPASHFQPQNLNAYSYCANSPINEKDILGMVSWGDKCILVADCYEKSCIKAQDPSHPCKRLMSDKKCEELTRSWFRTCMGGMATETPPDELPFNDVCHEMYKLFFVPIGPYLHYEVHE